MDRLGTWQWLLFSVVWLAASFGSGALLARLYKRLHPTLSFYKLWALWTVIVSLIAVAIFAIGIV